MKPNVIHIRDVPKQWKTNSNYIYIGRSGKGVVGDFGNPFKVGHKCDSCGQLHDDPGSTLECYRKYLIDKISSNELFKDSVRNLYGKILVCFCKPKVCHGDILADVCESIQSQ